MASLRTKLEAIVHGDVSLNRGRGNPPSIDSEDMQCSLQILQQFLRNNQRDTKSRLVPVAESINIIL